MKGYTGTAQASSSAQPADRRPEMTAHKVNTILIIALVAMLGFISYTGIEGSHSSPQPSMVYFNDASGELIAEVPNNPYSIMNETLIIMNTNLSSYLNSGAYYTLTSALNGSPISALTYQDGTGGILPQYATDAATPTYPFYMWSISKPAGTYNWVFIQTSENSFELYTYFALTGTAYVIA